MKALVCKVCVAFVASCLLVSSANAAVTIAKDIAYDDPSLASLTTGQILVTDFGTNLQTNAANIPVAQGYSFTWTNDSGDGPGTTVINSNATGLYSTETLISGISAPPPGNIPDYFTVVGPAGEAMLTTPNALTSFSLLWGSMDYYNTITFVGAKQSFSFTGDQVTVPNGGGDGDQSAEATNRGVSFTISAADDVKEVIFTSTQNSFEFDNLYASAVPEPALWLMMICGFGLTGAMLRRCRVVAVA